ncbi:MAG: hypothetical protein COB93_02225 [Sneathiella sp.]|nr:MAG: hypothetical protein COB93_02225 [Sneathiella sp.]
MVTKTLHTGKLGRNTGISSAPKLSLFGNIAQTVLTWQERASSRHQLASLDKKYLTDMGLTYHRAQDEISKPFWRS